MNPGEQWDNITRVADDLKALPEFVREEVAMLMACLYGTSHEDLQIAYEVIVQARKHGEQMALKRTNSPTNARAVANLIGCMEGLIHLEQRRRSRLADILADQPEAEQQTVMEC